MLDANPREKIRRWAVVFLLMQGIGGLIWWLGILSVPSWRVPFLAPGAPDATLLALAPGDLLFYLAGSFPQCLGPEATTALGMDGAVPAYRGSLLRRFICPRIAPAFQRRGPWGSPDGSLSSGSACFDLGPTPIKPAP